MRSVYKDNLHGSYVIGRNYHHWQFFLPGGIAGVSCWTISISADVVKSRFQTSPPRNVWWLVGCLSAFDERGRSHGTFQRDTASLQYAS